MLVITALGSVACQETPADETVERAVTEIVIYKPPRKTAYVPGEEFNSKGMIIKAKFNDGSTKTLTPQKCEISPNGPLSADTTEITVSYGGKSAVQKITILRDASRLSATLLHEDECAFPAGESIDFTQLLLVEAEFSDGNGNAVGDPVAVKNYEMTFDYQPADGGNDIDDIVFKDPTCVNVSTKGKYKVAVSALGQTSEKFDVAMFILKFDSLTFTSNRSSNNYAAASDESIDFAQDLNVTAKYLQDGNDDKTVEVPVSDYKLVFKDKDNESASGITADDPKNVTGLAAGEYGMTVKFGDRISQNTLDITVFNGFIAEAENVYDGDELILVSGLEFGSGEKQYNKRVVPESAPKSYVTVEKLGGAANWWQSVYEGYVRCEKGAYTFVRPTWMGVKSGVQPLDNCSGGGYMGELSRLKTLAVHFVSDVERDVDIIMHAASAMATDNGTADDGQQYFNITHDVPVGKVFNIYTDASAKQADGSFDTSKKLDLSGAVLPGGGKFTSEECGGNHLNDKIYTNWTQVTLGAMHLEKGDNVIYFDNIFNGGDSAWSGIGRKYGINLDSFEVRFK